MAQPQIVELRIHGVGGGTAQDMLGDDVVPIGDAADDIAGFWESPRPGGSPPRTRQVYAWGGFSGWNFTRAFWLLLLPFSVVNMAGWMVDPAGGPRVTAAQRALVRLIASAETVLLMVWMAAIAFDILDTSPPGRRLAMAAGAVLVVLVVIAVASKRSARYERFGAETSPEEVAAVTDDDLGLTDPEFWRTADVIEALRQSEFAVAAAAVAFLPVFSVWRATDALLPLALAVAAVLLATAALLVGLSRSPGPIATLLAWAGWLLAVAGVLTAWTADLPNPASDLDGLWAAPLWVLATAGVMVGALALVECTAWVRRGGRTMIDAGAWTTSDLRRAVLLAGLVAAGFVLFGGEGAFAATGWATLFGALSVVVPALILVLGRRRRLGRTICSILLVATVAAAVLVAVVAGGTLGATGWARAVAGAVAAAYPVVVLTLVSVRTTAVLVCAIPVIIAALLVAWSGDVWWLVVGAVFALSAVAVFAETGRRDRFRWLPVTTVSALSLLLLSVTYAGLSRIAHTWLGPDTALPSGHGWITAVFAGMTLAAALGAIVHLLHRRHEVWPVERVVPEYPAAPEPCRSTMAATAGRRRAVADLTGAVDVVVTLVTWGAVLTLLVGVIRAGRPALALWSPDRLHLALTASPWPQSWSWLTTGGSIVGAALPLLAIAAIALSIRFAAVRRKVGVVWDVGTFWPRRFHPLAPPAYAERAVPELVGHITRLASERGVVIVGHSQGSVLTLAAALQLEGVDPHRLAVVTHGSPLGRYYRRFWPALFGGMASGVAGSLRRDGGGERFWNAYRLTDAIGGPLFTGPDEQIGLEDTDLLLPDPRWTGNGCPDAQGHSGHLSDPVVVAKLDELGAATRP
ncbi:MAG: hypothetical protein ACR2JP_00070 [Acidimicrobiia bacterium]